MKNTFYQRIRRFPPILCRLLARHKHGRPLTNLEIADRSMLPIMTVHALSMSTDWQGVDIYDLQAFTNGCGIDLDNPRSVKRVVVYLRGKVGPNGKRIPPKFTYLRRSPDWRQLFKPMIERWIEHERINNDPK